MPDTATPHRVIVPGAFTGPWMWADVIDGLAEAGVAATVVALPTVGEDTTDRTFDDDVAAVRATLDGLDAPALLVGHSYGGAVITAAAAGPHPSVKELVYVAGAAPGSGESMATATAAAAERAGQEPGGPGPAPREDGLLVFPPEVARQALFNDCSDGRAQAALDQLRPQSFAGTDSTIETAAWTQLPTVYVRGQQDLVPRAISDEFLEAAVQVIDVDAGHCPHWSHPALIVQALSTRLTAAGLAG